MEEHESENNSYELDRIPHDPQPVLEQNLVLRGALKIEASTSTPNIVAGTEFSIYVVIRNPFQVPVTIHTIETHIPIELSDETWRKQNLLERLSRQRKIVSELNKNIDKALAKLNFSLSNAIRYLFPDKGPRVAVAVTTETQETIEYNEYKPERVVTIGKVESADNITVGDIFNLRFSGISDQDVQRILWNINEYRHGRITTVLQSGNSVVKHFVLKADKWLTFNPISHTFHLQIRYEVDGKSQIDSLPFSVNIRAPMRSSIIGSIIGGLLGYTVNLQGTVVNIENLVISVVRTIIFALIIIVAFSRKNDVQRIISVEDFWGGIFIGFLVGYSGETFIQSVLGIDNGN